MRVYSRDQLNLDRSEYRNIFFNFIRKENSVEVIDLMCNDSSSKTWESQGISFSTQISIPYFYPCIPWNRSYLFRYWEASLLIEICLLRVFEYLGIDHSNTPKVFIFIITEEGNSDQSFIYSDLRCCESGSMIIWISNIGDHILCEYTQTRDFTRFNGSTFLP